MNKIIPEYLASSIAWAMDDSGLIVGLGEMVFLHSLKK